MRIESGEFRGRTLQAPSGASTRPTDGRTREMLFNSLGERTIEARVLDLYAGTGAVGLEALSRGASYSVFVEQEHSALRALRANLKTLRLQTKTQVWAANARTAIQKLADNGEKFDFIFADPPFSLPNEAEEIVRRLDALPILLNNELTELQSSPDVGDSPSAVHALVVIQHSSRVTLPELERLRLLRQKRAGESTLSFFVLGRTRTQTQ